MSFVRKGRHHPTTPEEGEASLRLSLGRLVGAGGELSDEERERLRQGAATDAVKTARGARSLDAQTVEHLRRRALGAIRDVQTEAVRARLLVWLDAEPS